MSSDYMEDCIDCVNFFKKEPDINREDCWFNYRCKAPKLQTGVSIRDGFAICRYAHDNAEGLTCLYFCSKDPQPSEQKEPIRNRFDILDI